MNMNKPKAGDTVDQPPYGPCEWKDGRSLTDAQRSQVLALQGKAPDWARALVLVIKRTGRVALVRSV